MTARTALVGTTWGREEEGAKGMMGKKGERERGGDSGVSAAVARQGTLIHAYTMNTATLSPTSPKVKRRQSARARQRTGSYLAPQQTQETHDAALYSIRTFLRSRTSYDAFPVSFRLIVLDSQLEVKKALQCLLLNGRYISDVALFLES
jgi:hypothetical protein